MGTFLIVMFNFVQMFMVLALVYWYRDCEPQLSGAIRTVDQVSFITVEVRSIS